MTKKQILTVRLIALFVLSATFSHSQIDTFNLNSYKKPNLERHKLNFQFKLDNDWDNYYSKTQDITEGNEIRDISYFDMGANIGAQYKGYFNNREYEGKHTMNLGVSPYLSQYDRKEPDSSLDNKKSFETNFHGTSFNRFYLGNLFFVESDVLLHNLLEFSKNVIDKETESQKDITSHEMRRLNVAIPVLAGKGRIEPIQDARMAVYIMDQLSKKGKLKRKPTKEEIIAFAEQIAEIKNERFFDARNRRVYEMTQLDSFLNKNGLLDEKDIEYYTTMNDYWEYANNPQRNSGKRFSIGVEPSYRYDYSFDYQDPASGSAVKTSYKENEYGLLGVIRYNYEKPINLYWQSSFNAEFKFGRESKNTINGYGSDSKRLKGNILNSSINYILGWYPNSRSYYNLNITGQFFKFFQLEDQFDSKSNYLDYSDEQNIYLRAGVSGYYYISPRIRLSGGFNIGYMKDSRPEQDEPVQFDNIRLISKNWGYELYFSLKYSLF
jgi:hypothetical protein